MATTKSIKEAIKAIPEKKESLRKAFEEFRSLSGALSSFTLKWEDLDNHFSALSSSIDLRFKQLQSLENQNKTPSKEFKPLPSARPPPKSSTSEPESEPRPELLDLCSRMDGPALRDFVTENRKDLASLRAELAPAIRSAPDPAKLVLDAVTGPYGSGAKEAEHFGRRTRILLLEKLCSVRPDVISPEVTEAARKIAVDWKEKIGSKKEGGGSFSALDASLPAWAFLQLVAAYRLASEFEVAELLDIIVPIARRKPIIDICNALDVVEHIPTLIEKLIGKGKQLDAVKFVYAYGLVEKFPPVPLLKDYVKESKKVAQEVLKKGKNSAQSRNEATAKEISALKSVIKAIEEYKLESAYPPVSLEKQVDKLEKTKAERKRTTTVQNQENANKRPRAFGASSAPAAVAFSTAPLLSNPSQSYVADRPSYLSSVGSYGMPARAGLGLLEPSLVPGGVAKLSPPRSSYLYPTESRIPSGLYDRPGAYDGPGAYDMPLSYDRKALYDRPPAHDRAIGYGSYSLS